jgi:transposase-like protein
VGTEGRTTADVDVSADQIAIDENVIRVDGDEYWLYGVVDPERTSTNKVNTI